MAASVTSGAEQWAKEIDLDAHYAPYPHQAAFHASPAPHRLLGGAAGPGKTLALIGDHLISCIEFSAQDAPQVHTLLLRRVHPDLKNTVITRFDEKVPKELYRDFNRTDGIVTWLNGATTKFASMQYEHDVWRFQGQWFKIGYDELTEFTFSQWANISAWNRCPVSPYATKDGATNPIGIGAQWVEDLFLQKHPCEEMDSKQRASYRPEDYAYFPATYLENPVYANDPRFIAQFDNYQATVAEALKFGKWGVAGGYFDGAWDRAVNVYAPGSLEMKPWWKRWLSGDWGFEHNFAIYWHCLDDLGIVRTYRELVDNHHTPEELGEAIVKANAGDKLQQFSFSHDAFAQKQDSNTIALRTGRVLRAAGLPEPSISTRDKIGRERLMYSLLKQRVLVGEVFDDATRSTIEVKEARLQISEKCPYLIRAIPKAPRDPDNKEEIAEFLGDDPLQGAGYGYYAEFGGVNAKPFNEILREELRDVTDPTSRNVHTQRLVAAHESENRQTGRLRWMRNR
jgi:hypothetical protein